MIIFKGDYISRSQHDLEPYIFPLRMPLLKCSKENKLNVDNS